MPFFWGTKIASLSRIRFIMIYFRHDDLIIRLLHDVLGRSQLQLWITICFFWIWIIVLNLFDFRSWVMSNVSIKQSSRLVAWLFFRVLLRYFNVDNCILLLLLIIERTRRLYQFFESVNVCRLLIQLRWILIRALHVSVIVSILFGTGT